MSATKIIRAPYNREDSNVSQREFSMLLRLYHSLAALDIAVLQNKPKKTVTRLKCAVITDYQSLNEWYEGKETSTVLRRNKKAPARTGAMRRSA